MSEATSSIEEPKLIPDECDRCSKKLVYACKGCRRMVLCGECEDEPCGACTVDCPSCHEDVFAKDIRLCEVEGHGYGIAPNQEQEVFNGYCDDCLKECAKCHKNFCRNCNADCSWRCKQICRPCGRYCHGCEEVMCDHERHGWKECPWCGTEYCNNKTCPGELEKHVPECDKRLNQVCVACECIFSLDRGGHLFAGGPRLCGECTKEVVDSSRSKRRKDKAKRRLLRHANSGSQRLSPEL